MEHKRPSRRRAVKTVSAPPAAIDPQADDRSRFEVVESYFDHDGRPTQRAGLGAARVSRAYDSEGHQIEERYFNAEGKPTVRKDIGAARISWRYDGDGRQVDTTLFGPDGAPVRRHRTAQGKRTLERT